MSGRTMTTGRSRISRAHTVVYLRRKRRRRMEVERRNPLRQLPRLAAAVGE
ncbi:hypothetical protein ABIA39_006883 [Nocardia sp. GAS34]|uniref:hypothetical protein n=1 Tax=unclassified Nocardia TaxID=2637762 RepID=UPI003D20106C